MTCPDDPAELRRMLTPSEPIDLVSEVARLKRLLAMKDQTIEAMRLELVARRFHNPDLVWHPPNARYHEGMLTYNGVSIYEE